MVSHLGFSQSIMGLHGGYDNKNSRERNKNEIVLTKLSQKIISLGSPHRPKCIAILSNAILSIGANNILI